MSVGVDADRHTVPGKKPEVLPVRIEILKGFVPSVCVQFKGDIMYLKGGRHNAVKVADV